MGAAAKGDQIEIGAVEVQLAIIEIVFETRFSGLVTVYDARRVHRNETVEAAAIGFDGKESGKEPVAIQGSEQVDQEADVTSRGATVLNNGQLLDLFITP